jgi:putative ABC transport system substrate-binding protein
MIRRLAFLAFIGGMILGLLAVPLAASAQQAGAIPKIVFVGASSNPNDCNEPTEGMRAFRDGLSDLGYVIDQTIIVERRCPASLSERLATYGDVSADVTMFVSPDADMAARGLVRIAGWRGVRVPVEAAIFSSLGPLRGPNTIPMYLDADTRRLEFLRAMAPEVSRLAVLTIGGSIPVMRSEFEAAGRSLDLRIHTFDIGNSGDLDSAFVAIRRERLQAIMIKEGDLIFTHRHRVMKWIADYPLPAAFAWRRFAEEGGLMSYGVDVADLYRRLAGRVDKVLRAVDFPKAPVEQPKLELVINLKTAKALGLTIPESVLLRADQVIE